MVYSSFNLASALILIGCLALLIFSCSPINPSLPPAAVRPKAVDADSAFDHSHELFERLLMKYVDNGLVDYRSFMADSDDFYSYLAELGSVSQAAVNMWTRNQQMAYWINAYNAFTIQAVIEHYPIKGRSLVGIFAPQNSILQISGVWNRLRFDAGGQTLTLGHIEHKILRADFKDPRIHFAIVCASRSCPALRSEAYRFDRLEHQLHGQTVRFINDPTRGVRWDAATNRLFVSKIFKWFKKDFKAASRPVDPAKPPPLSKDPVLAFILPYLRGDVIKGTLTDGRHMRMSYLPYDWHLNDRVNATSEPSAASPGNDV